MCQFNKPERILKNHRLKLLFFSFVVVLCFVFIEPRTTAAESENDFFRDLASVLHQEANREPGQTEKTTPPNSERIFPKLLPSAPHAQLPLSDHLKLFYNIQRIKGDYYEQRNYNKKCPIFGIDIFF